MDNINNNQETNIPINEVPNEGNKEKENLEDDIRVMKQVGKYQLFRILGRGTFGVVYLGKNTETGDLVAVKRYFMNLHPNLCQLEISILSYLNKKTNDKNILKILDGFVLEDDIFLILSYQKHLKFTDYLSNISLFDLKKYMYDLLCCLESIHKHGIVHRDLKPDNFLYDLESHTCLLIDFGLSESEMDEPFSNLSIKGASLNTVADEDLKIILEIQKTMGIKHRIGTRGFLAPEVIFNAKYQGKSVDIWAAGVIFLCFLAKRMPVFNLNKFCKIQDETIKEIEPLIIVFGKDKIIEVAQKHHNMIFLPEIFSRYALTNDLMGMILREDIKEDGVDLLRRMLELDCDKRISAEEAKQHSFFNEVVANK